MTLRTSGRCAHHILDWGPIGDGPLASGLVLVVSIGPLDHLRPRHGVLGATGGRPQDCSVLGARRRDPNSRGRLGGRFSCIAARFSPKTGPCLGGKSWGSRLGAALPFGLRPRTLGAGLARYLEGGFLKIQFLNFLKLFVQIDRELRA